MKEYRVVDIYEDFDVLGIVNSKADARRLARERSEDTDDECYIILQENVLGYWIPVENWVY